MPTNRFPCIPFLVLLLSALPAAAEVVFGPEIPITLPTVEPLPQSEARGVAAPLWTGQEWLFTWGDTRARDGVYLHRLGGDGSSPDDSNQFVRRGVPHGLVPSGSGYLIAIDGIDRLDHVGAPVERILHAESRILAADASILAWHPELSSVTLIEGSVTTPVDVATLTGGLSPWQEPAVATDGTSYLVTWIRRSFENGGNRSIRYNLVGPRGEVLLDEPGVIAPEAEGETSVVAAWDGSRYLIGWTAQTSGGFWDFAVAALDVATGASTGPWTVTQGANWNWSGPQMIRVEPGLVLLVWTELQHTIGSLSRWVTRARFLEDGIPVGEPLLVSEEPVMLGFDGGNTFAAISSSTMARLYTRSGLGLEPATGAITLRYGIPDRVGLAISDFDPFAMWMSGGPLSWFVNAGRHERTTQPLVPTRMSGEPGASPAHAANGDARLMTWSGSSSTSSAVRYALADREGNFLSEPVVIEPGSDPTVAAHGTGWLLTWERGGLLRFAFVGPDGRLPRFPENLADPEPQPFPVADRQTGIVFVRIDENETLVLWQEGDYQALCEVSACPVPPAPASIRSMIVRDGTPDRSTLRTYAELGVAGGPAAVRVGDRILLVAVRQSELWSGSIEGMELDLEGEPVSEPFMIADQISPSDVGTPDLALLGATVVAVWTREIEDGAFVGKIGGVLIEGLPARPSVSPIELPAPLGARSLLLVTETESRAALYYERPADMATWNGTRQIFTRTIFLDPSARRRPVSRR